MSPLNKIAVFPLVILCLGFVVACGGGSGFSPLDLLNGGNNPGPTTGDLTITPATLTNGTENAAYAATALSASGGTAPYAYSLASGTYPPGFNPTQLIMGSVTGTPTTPGTYTFTIEATDSSATTLRGTRQYTLTIAAEGGSSGSITVTPTSLPNGTENTAYTTTALSASGGTAPYAFIMSTGTYPTGMDPLMLVLGSVTGTPTAAGTYTFTVQATDSSTPALTGTRDYTITIAADTGGGGGGGSGFELIAGTDPWLVDFDFDGSGNSISDFDDALATIGVSSQRQSIIDGALGQMWTVYRNNADGTLNTSTGLGISFSDTPPASMTELPSDWAAAQAGYYNVIQQVDNGTTGAAGLMGLDGGNISMQNTRYSNQGKSPGQFVGVSASRIAQSRSTATSFQRQIASTTAHEVGHALGNQHVNNGFIMDSFDGGNRTLDVGDALYNSMKTNNILPGPNR